MKVIKSTSLLIFLMLFYACKKHDTPVTRVVKFGSTTYQTLGGYDSSGKPDYLLPKDTISANLLSFINSMLSNGVDLRTTHPELLESAAIADIKVTTPSDIYMTFVSQGSGFTNSIAFYTYPTNQPPASTKDITTITYAFPNAGNYTPLQPGDKVKLGRFNAGTSVGFVLLQSAWNTTSAKLDSNVVHFCSNDTLNPEIDPNLKRHAVLINYVPENKVLIGFEDTDRTRPSCDNDFNDVVFYCTVTP